MYTTLSQADRVAIQHMARRGLSPAAIARELELPEYLVVAGLNSPRRDRQPGILSLSQLFYWG